MTVLKAELYHVLLLLVIVRVGAVVSTLLPGEVQVWVFPTLSVIVTLQVLPLALPVVQEPPAVAIPLPRSVLPLRVKAWVPLTFQGDVAGDQPLALQTGTVLSNLKLKVLVSLLYVVPSLVLVFTL
jgi:hypothetical protein